MKNFNINYKEKLSFEEVDEIIDKVEDLLIKPKPKIVYNLDELLPYSRIDVMHAFMIQIASEVYLKHNESDVTDLIGSMNGARIMILSWGIPSNEFADRSKSDKDSSLLEIASHWSLLGTSDSENADEMFIKEERKYIAGMESFFSFRDFCNSVLGLSHDEYWNKVFLRIGIKNQELKMDSSSIILDKKSNIKGGIKKNYKIEFVILLLIVILTLAYVYFDEISRKLTSINKEPQIKSEISSEKNKSKTFGEDYEYLEFKFKNEQLDVLFTSESFGKNFSIKHFEELNKDIGSYENYENLFSGVPKENIFGVIYGANFVKKNITNDRKNGSKIFISYYPLYKQLIDYYIEDNYERYAHLLELNSSALPVDSFKFRIYKENIEELGMKLDYSEGTYFVNYNYNFLIELFSSIVTNDIIDYLQILQIEQENPYQEDAGLKISKQKLFQRILKLETYIDKYPNGYFKSTARNDYYNYLEVAFLGLDNSQIFDSDGFLLNEERVFIKDIVDRFSHTKSGQFFALYYDRLASNNFAFSYDLSLELMDSIKSIY